VNSLNGIVYRFIIYLNLDLYIKYLPDLDFDVDSGYVPLKGIG
jgi:hypothetical protein